VHGAIGEEHVRVDDGGAVRLVGFAQSTRTADGADPGDDVAALGAFITARLAMPEARGEPHRDQLSDLARQASGRELSARELADAIAALAPHHEPRRSLPPRERSHSRRRIRPAAAATALGVLLIAPVAFILRSQAPPRQAEAIVRPRPPTTSTTLTPAVDYHDGIYRSVDGSWSVGANGDLVVLGDWDCDGEDTLALLRPSTGGVFAFAAWATDDRDVSADPLSVVAGATTIDARDTDGDGCDDVVVTDAAGVTTVLHPADRL
jgi:hypothetical protein